MEIPRMIQMVGMQLTQRVSVDVANRWIFITINGQQEDILSTSEMKIKHNSILLRTVCRQKSS